MWKYTSSCSLSSFGTPMMQMLECLKLSQKVLNSILGVFWILSSSCSDWLFLASLCSITLIRFSASSTVMLFPYKLFISISVPYISDCTFFMLLRSSLSSLSILITNVLNSASDRLLTFVSFFFWRFDLFFHLSHVI